jgi:hypothetical protein
LNVNGSKGSNACAVFLVRKKQKEILPLTTFAVIMNIVVKMITRKPEDLHANDAK